MANSSSGDSVVKRLVKVFSAFDSRHTSMSVAALARRTGLPESTAYRLVGDLIDEGLLERGSGGQIQVGVRMWELVSRSSTMLGLREAALPFMEDVQSAVQHHTTLGILDHDEVLYIERIGSNSSAINITKVAGRLPIHGCSSGLVMLAYASVVYQDLVLSRNLPKFTPTTLTQPGELRRELAEIRHHGYAASSGIIVPESSGIAVPVFDVDNSVIAALSVVVPRTEENISARVPVLKAAAHGISRTLGRAKTSDGTIRRSTPAPRA